VKLTLDLHDIYNSGPEIEKALKQKFDEAVAKKAPLLEIIPGKGTGKRLEELRAPFRALPLEIAINSCDCDRPAF
jgi:dsDNA-specific endonuclease/ATPase MutS2